MPQPRLSKKELKEDEFVNTFEKVLHYVSRHSKIFTFGVFALLFLLVHIIVIPLLFFPLVLLFFWFR